MPITNNIQIITATSGGGTTSLPTYSAIAEYIIKGTVTLTSNWTIQPSGTPIAGMQYDFKYEATLDLNGNTLTIFGETFPIELQDKTCEISCYWDGTDWDVNIKPDVLEDGCIPNSSIAVTEYVDAFINQYSMPPAIDYLYMGISLGTGTVDTTDSYIRTNNDTNRKIISLVGHVEIELVDETTLNNSTLYDFASLPTLIGTGVNYILNGHLYIGNESKPITVYVNTANLGKLQIQFGGSLGTSTSTKHTIILDLKIPY